MIIRQITLKTEPPQVFQLYFDSRSNAEKDPQIPAENVAIYEDDYKQRAIIGMTMIAADIVIDLGEQMRAVGEVEIAKMTAELKFNDRIDKDTVIKTHLNKKKAQQMAASMPRVAMPPGAA
jgi:hypothetical protein